MLLEPLKRSCRQAFYGVSLHQILHDVNKEDVDDIATSQNVTQLHGTRQTPYIARSCEVGYIHTYKLLKLTDDRCNPLVMTSQEEQIVQACLLDNLVPSPSLQLAVSQVHMYDMYMYSQSVAVQ